jgi:hypothetical protein
MVSLIRRLKKRTQFFGGAGLVGSSDKTPDKTNPIFVDAYGVNASAGFARISFWGDHDRCRPLNRVRRFLILSISSRAAGAADLSPRVFLPPAGLNRIEAQALGTLDGEAVYFTRSMRWFSGTRVCWARMLPDRSEGLPAWRISRSAPCQEVQYRRSATFPAQGDNCRKAPRRAAPS